MRTQLNLIKPKPMRISPWKGPWIFLEFLNLSKFSTKNIETLFQRQNMEETFSSNQDMDVGSYLNGGKSLWEQDSLVETWTIIGENRLV